MSTLRPDERASQAEIERSQRLQRTAQGIAGTALTIGATSKVLPFLSEMLPMDLAIKGISKVAPGIGNFLKKGMSQGLDVKDGFDFIKQNFMKDQEKAPDKRNIIEQYDPELFRFMNEGIQKGRAPLQVGAIAEMGGKFKDSIKKMVRDHKTPWSSIIETVFGSGQLAQQNQTSNTQQSQQQSGQGQQALMNILQKIQQSRGA